MKQGIGQVWLSTEAMVVHDNKIWFAEADSNEVYSYDLETKKCSLVCEIAEEPKDGKRLFGTMEVYEECLYLFPFSAKNAYRVNMYTGEVKLVKIEDPPKSFYKKYDSNAKFLSSFINMDRIFAVGVTYPGIIEYEIDTERILYHNEWLSDMEIYFKNDEKALFRKAIMEDGKIYAPSCKGNVILIYDVSNGKYELCQVGSEDCCFSSICFDGTDFWLAPRQGDSIIRWNESCRNYVQYNEFPQKFQRGTFNDIACIGTSIVLLPGNANMFLEIDKKTGIVREFNKEWRNIHGISKYMKENILYIFSRCEATLIIFHIWTKTFQKIRISGPSTKSKHINIQCIWEDNWGGLKEYVSFLERNSGREEKRDNNVQVAGKQIWNQMNKF